MIYSFPPFLPSGQNGLFSNFLSFIYSTLRCIFTAIPCFWYDGKRNLGGKVQFVYRQLYRQNDPQCRDRRR